MGVDENDKKKPLYVPTRNILETADYIEGIGAKEAGIIVVASVVSIILFFLLLSVYGSNQIIIPLGISMVVIGGTITLVKRDKYNESIFDKLHLIYDFAFRQQKKYEYTYVNYRYSNLPMSEDENEESRK